MFRSPFKNKATLTTAFKKPGNLWKAGYHTGEDWVSNDTTLVSPAKGMVVKNACDAKGYGNYVIIQTESDMVILMGHMKERSPCPVGAAVSPGSFIGTMGSTGNSSGPHLHIELQSSKIWKYNQNLLKPSLYVDFNNYKGGDFMAKPYQNGSTPETVFSDSGLINQIGRLNPYEKCECIGIEDGVYIVKYKIDNNIHYKVGFVKYSGGVL